MLSLYVVDVKFVLYVIHELIVEVKSSIYTIYIYIIIIDYC
jgi:hypothetical protein